MCNPSEYYNADVQLHYGVLVHGIWLPFYFSYFSHFKETNKDYMIYDYYFSPKLLIYDHFVKAVFEKRKRRPFSTDPSV